MTKPTMNVIDDQRPAAAAGLDQAWYRWSPLPRRVRRGWPDGAAVAVCVVIDLGAAEWDREPFSPVPAPGGRGIAPPPDFPRLSHREFGHRVGVFRLLELVHRLGVPSTAAVDVMTVEQYGALLPHLHRVVGEFVAHGLSASRPITSQMSEAEERHYIATALERLDRGLGTRPRGWLGPEHSESARTPALLAAAGVEYVLDWGNDEQPYPMPGAGPLWALPLSWELCDLNAAHVRLVLPHVYAQSIIDAFDVMRHESAEAPRLLAIHLHPWISGQAFRIDALERALTHIVGSGAAWLATPGQVVEWARHAAADGSGP